METDRIILAIDFDGTIVKPGPDNYKLDDFELMPNAKSVLKDLYKKAYLILWTCRQGKELEKALKFLKKNGIKFHKINENVDTLDFKTSDKIFADIYFDDRANTGKIDWQKFKKQVEKEMKKSAVLKVADEIMLKVAQNMVDAAVLRERPSYYRTPQKKKEEPKGPQLSELQKDRQKASDDLKRIWNQVGGNVVDSLKEKEKTPEIEEFQQKVKEIVVKRGLPDNTESADWLDGELKKLTKHDWLIPPSAFHPRKPTTIQAFKQDEMKK